MLNAPGDSEATISWMTHDVAQRCTAALETLLTSNISALQLRSAAVLLRSASNDLDWLVELGEGPGTLATATDNPAFGLSSGINPSQDPASAE